MTPDEYRDKLARLHELMDAAPGTPEERELIALGEELDAYETEHYPIAEPSPEAAARFRAEQERR